MLRIAVPADGHRDPVRQLKTVRRPPIYPNGTQAISPVAPSPPPPLSSRRPSVSFGGFGLRLRFLYSDIVHYLHAEAFYEGAYTDDVPEYIREGTEFIDLAERLAQE